MSNFDDYLSFIVYSEGHALIADLIKDLLLGLDDKVKELHIESQLLPQLVGFAKDVIDQCLEVVSLVVWLRMLMVL